MNHTFASCGWRCAAVLPTVLAVSEPAFVRRRVGTRLALIPLTTLPALWTVPFRLQPGSTNTAWRVSRELARRLMHGDAYRVKEPWARRARAGLAIKGHKVASGCFTSAARRRQAGRRRSRWCVVAHQCRIYNSASQKAKMSGWSSHSPQSHTRKNASSDRIDSRENKALSTPRWQ